MDFDQLERKRALTPAEGYSSHVGMLVASLEYCRRKTLNNVAGLTPYQLDYRQDDLATNIIHSPAFS